jgi:thioesterase domain-containing protein
MARTHVASLRQVQPTGPYRLGGFCLGGVIAFEMARQLMAHGERIERLVLVDCQPVNARLQWMRPLMPLVPGDDETHRLSRRANVLKRVRRYRHRMRQVRRMEAGDQLAWARSVVSQKLAGLLGRRRAQRASVPAPAPAPAQDAGDAILTPAIDGPGVQVWRMHERAASAYIPHAFPGIVDFIWADDRPGPRPAVPTRGWELVAERVNFYPLQSSHLGLLTNKLPLFAQALRDALERR